MPQPERRSLSLVASQPLDGGFLVLHHSQTLAARLFAAVLWNTRVETSDASFGVRTNRFGFTISGTSGLTIVVELSTNLANPAWTPVGTSTLTSGSSYFSDPEWTNHPARNYRLRSP